MCTSAPVPRTARDGESGPPNPITRRDDGDLDGGVKPGVFQPMVGPRQSHRSSVKAVLSGLAPHCQDCRSARAQMNQPPHPGSKPCNHGAMQRRPNSSSPNSGTESRFLRRKYRSQRPRTGDAAPPAHPTASQQCGMPGRPDLTRTAKSGAKAGGVKKTVLKRAHSTDATSLGWPPNPLSQVRFFVKIPPSPHGPSPGLGGRLR